MPTLVHTGSPFLNFRTFDFPAGRGHDFRWVHGKRFRLEGDAPDDRGLLAALIAHPQFRDTYDGAGVWTEPRHGQWWADRITPETYAVLEPSDAVSLIRSWAEDGAELPAELDRRLHQDVYAAIRRASSVHVLGPLPDDARHDYGPIHDEFHELVLIDRDEGVLLLMVAADD